MTIAAILGNKGDDVFSVECDTPVRDVVARLAEHRIGALPVMKDGKVAGIVSERDIVYRLASDGADMLDWTVDRVMTAPAITITGGINVLVALSMMTKRRVRHLPVVEDEAMVGFVSIGDLVKYRIEKIEQEAEAMRSYISGA